MIARFRFHTNNATLNALLCVFLIAILGGWVRGLLCGVCLPARRLFLGLVHLDVTLSFFGRRSPVWRRS